MEGLLFNPPSPQPSHTPSHPHPHTHTLTHPHPQLDRLWSRALEFKARRGEFGRAGLTAMQRLDADRQRLVIQGGAMYAHEWLPRYISTGMGPMLPMGLDTVAMSGQRAMAGQRSVPMVVQCSVGNIPMPHVTLHDDSIKTHKDEEQPIDPVRGVGAYASKACLWGAEGSPEAVVEEWMQQLVSTDHAFVTLSPQVCRGVGVCFLQCCGWVIVHDPHKVRIV